MIGVGFIFSSDVDAVARGYPNVHFACVDYAPSQDERVCAERVWARVSRRRRFVHRRRGRGSSHEIARRRIRRQGRPSRSFENSKQVTRPAFHRRARAARSNRRTPARRPTRSKIPRRESCSRSAKPPPARTSTSMRRARRVTASSKARRKCTRSRSVSTRINTTRCPAWS